MSVMRYGLVLVLGALLMVGSVACGTDDDDGGSSNNASNNASNNGGGEAVCGSDTGCGGDLVGSHTFEDICLEGETTFPAGIENCPSATVSIMDPTVSGSVTLMEDGTYNIQNTFATVTTVVLPAECLGGQEPAAICATIEMDLDDGSCEVVDGGCSCTQASVEQSDESGTWSVEGNLLTTTPEGDDAEPDTLEFCVQGDTAIIKPVDTDGEEPFEVSFIMRRQ